MSVLCTIVLCKVPFLLGIVLVADCISTPRPRCVLPLLSNRHYELCVNNAGCALRSISSDQLTH